MKLPSLKKEIFCKNNVICKAARKIYKKYGPIKLFLSIIFVTFLILFFQEFKTFSLLFVLFIAAIFSTFYVRFIRISIGIELRTLLFVIVSLKVDPFLGLVLTLLSIVTGMIISFDFQPTFFITPLTYIILALILPILAPLDITIAGIIITVIYNLILHSLYYFVFKYPIALSIPSLIGNIIFNIIIFIRFAPAVAALF